MEAILREIGLTEGEIKVYLALLDEGSTTTGSLIKRSKVSASKVYQILERLSQKGLVSSVIKQKTRYFQATDPKRILDYLAEKENAIEEQKHNIQKVLPLLLAKHQEKTREEVEMYKGMAGVRNMFYSILDDLKKGDEYHVISAGWGFEREEEGRTMLNAYHEQRVKKGIYAHLLFNFESFPLARTVSWGGKLCAIKSMPQDLTTTTQIMIFKDKIFIILWKKDPLGFVIKDMELRETFKKYFDVLWNQDMQIFHGFDGVKRLCNIVIEEKADLYLIGANGMLYKKRPELFRDFDKRRLEAGIRRHHLSIAETRNLPVNTQPNTDVKYLPREFSSPLVIWIFGDYVANILWEKEELIFLIKNKNIAEDYRKYFSFIWNQQTHTYYGYEGLKEIFEDTLNCPEVWFIGGGGYITTKMPEYWKDYNRRRLEKKQRWRNLARGSITDTPLAKAQNHEYKILPQTYTAPNVIWIFGDKVANVLWTEEPIAFVVENKEVAQSYREYFEYLWETVKE